MFNFSLFGNKSQNSYIMFKLRKQTFFFQYFGYRLNFTLCTLLRTFLQSKKKNFEVDFFVVNAVDGVGKDQRREAFRLAFEDIGEVLSLSRSMWTGLSFCIEPFVFHLEYKKNKLNYKLAICQNLFKIIKM